ncbi:unnamed protein product [Allacma fusca]|uniref:Uncharacterized protein n=1 Tax=Allacma fusca TaxID=39272 RepID=A0A8J2KWI0_9HEXA|nr:unnamed protein product [Allacma fusca]
MVKRFPECKRLFMDSSISQDRHLYFTSLPPINPQQKQTYNKLFRTAILELTKPRTSTDHQFPQLIFIRSQLDFDSGVSSGSPCSLHILVVISGIKHHSK